MEHARSAIEELTARIEFAFQCEHCSRRALVEEGALISLHRGSGPAFCRGRAASLIMRITDGSGRKIGDGQVLFSFFPPDLALTLWGRRHVLRQFPSF